MQLKEPISNLLEQLQYVIDELNPGQYTEPVKLLSQSSIGQHTRHILEFFVELNKGYESGMVDYDKRIRNKAIEADKDFAIGQQIIGSLDDDGYLRRPITSLTDDLAFSQNVMADDDEVEGFVRLPVSESIEPVSVRHA